MAFKPPKFVIFALVVAVGGVAIFLTKRRVPVCEGNGKHMATLAECQNWGFAAELCKEATEKAHAMVERAGPKTETMFQCEVRFTDCFRNAAGTFSPQPLFCLRPETGAEPKEVRYLEFESDRRNRKKTKEVRVD